MNVFRRLISKIRGGDKGSGLPRTDAGAAERVRLTRSGEMDSRIPATQMMKKGGKVGASKMGAVKTSKPSMGSASKRADGIAQRGKTRGRMV
jgi:hypothetical protein